MGFDYTSVHVIESVIREKKESSVTQVTNHGLDNRALREILNQEGHEGFSFCATMPLLMAVRTFSRLRVWHIAPQSRWYCSPERPQDVDDTHEFLFDRVD